MANLLIPSNIVSKHFSMILKQYLCFLKHIKESKLINKMNFFVKIFYQVMTNNAVLLLMKFGVRNWEMLFVIRSVTMGATCYLFLNIYFGIPRPLLQRILVISRRFKIENSGFHRHIENSI